MPYEITVDSYTPDQAHREANALVWHAMKNLSLNWKPHPDNVIDALMKTIETLLIDINTADPEKTYAKASVRTLALLTAKYTRHYNQLEEKLDETI